MKNINFMITILFYIIFSSAMAETEVMIPSGKFLAGDGVEIEMAEFTAKNTHHLHDVLLKMIGVKAYKAGIEQ